MHRSTRVLSIVALATLVAVPATSLPVLAQSGSASEITHRQSVRTELSPSGDVTASRVFTQLTVKGDGPVEVVLPSQSTRGLRNLDAFGRPRVDGDQVVFSVEASPQGANERTVADHTADLPIELEVRYVLDGQEVTPQELVGRSGQLEVSFTARNTTMQPTEVTYVDGLGETHTETIDVAVPFVGSISMELDRRFVEIDAPLASVAGNGRGDTFVSWSLVMFEPIGAEEQTVVYTAQVTDAVVPSVVAQFLPVDSNSFGSLSAVQNTFGAVADGLRDLTDGGSQIDENVQLLAAGAAQLLAGLGQLTDGASQLSEGLNDNAVPGSRELADGARAANEGGQRLSNGLNDLQVGAGDLSRGLGQARGGTNDLADGLDQLVDGTDRLGAGASQLSSGASQLDGSAGQLAGGSTQVRDGAAGLLAGLLTLRDSINDPEALPQAIGGVTQLRGAVAGMQAGIGAAETDNTLLDGTARLEAGLSRTRGGLTNPACNLANPTAPDNPCGVHQGAQLIADGATKLQTAADRAGDMLRGIGRDSLTGADEAALDGAIAILGDPGHFDPNTIRWGAVGIGDGATNIIGGVDQIVAGIGDPAAADTLRNGVARIAGGLSNPGCSLANPTDPTNPCGLLQVLGLVDTGLDDLGEGLGGALDSLNAGLGSTSDDPATTPTLLGGANALAKGSQDLAVGADRLQREGTGPLAAGAGGLAAGARELGAGAGRAAAGSSDLRNGLIQLDDGGQQLAAGARTAASGAGELSEGLGRLDDGANRLADGLEDAGDGSLRLADGLGEAEDGGDQLADGAQRLTDEGTSLLVAGANDAIASPALAVEHARAADARGQAGEGLPYGTVDGAVASAVYQFELAGLGADDGPSVPVRIALTVLGFGVAGALSVGVRRRLI